MNRPVIKNLLLENIDYKTDKTQFGVWRRFVYPNGDLFEEFKSHSRFMGFPLMHYTRGKCPETGQRIIAKGIIAIGRLTVGGLAIGQFATGYTAIGQFALGKYVLAQKGFGEFVWDMKHTAPEAKEYFLSLLKLH